MGPEPKFDLPATLGSDVAGVVVEVGDAVTGFKIGDAVFASVFDLGRGTLTGFVAVPERVAAHKPESLDFVQAASIPMVGLTSWQALTERTHVAPGQKVFIPAGSGGIGTFAIQLARHLGAHVATTTSTTNIELVKALGANEVVDYRKQDFEGVLSGYDMALGTIRGDGVEKALKILRPGGVVVSLIGPLDAAFARTRNMNAVSRLLYSLMSRKVNRIAKDRGARYSFLFVRPDGAQLAQIGRIIDTGSIRPVIDRVFPFDETKEALDYLETGRAKGKVVVQMV